MTAIDVFFLFCVFFAIVYVCGTGLVFFGSRRFREGVPPVKLPFVSIILCAYNEEEIIGRCLDSLRTLDYPRESMELILVDDESEDGTRELFKTFADGLDNAHVLSTAGVPRRFPGKQRPLDLGIRRSRGEIILVTDADCILDPGWVRAHVAAFDDNTGIVGAITGITTSSGTLFSRLQNSDLVSKLAVAMGGAGLGLPLAIMGNNMSFRRAAYDACGGFDRIGPSIVEDADLLYAIARYTHYRIGWVRSRKPLAVSLPLTRFGTLIDQRWRMLNVSGGVPSFGKMLITLEVLMALMFIVTAILAPADIRPLMVIASAWVTGQFLLLLPAAVSPLRNLLYIPAIIAFQAAYGVALGFSVLFGKRHIRWKERVYDRKNGDTAV